MQTKSKEVCAKPFAKSGNKRALEVNLPIQRHQGSDRLILYHARVPPVSILRPGKARTQWDFFIRLETECLFLKFGRELFFGFVTGHDFSRAVTAIKSIWALAPEGFLGSLRIIE